jgi:hypothetical protein
MWIGGRPGSWMLMPESVSGGGWAGAGAGVVVVAAGSVVGGSVTGGAAVVGGSVGAGVVGGGGAGVVAGGAVAEGGGGGGSVLGSGSGAGAGSVVGGRVPERDAGRVVVVVVVVRRGGALAAGATTDVSTAGAVVSAPATATAIVDVGPAVVEAGTVVPVAGRVVLGATVVDTVLTSTEGDGEGWVSFPPDDGTVHTRAKTPKATSSPAMITLATRRRLRGRSVRSSYSSSSITSPAKVVARWRPMMGL